MFIFISLHDIEHYASGADCMGDTGAGARYSGVTCTAKVT